MAARKKCVLSEIEMKRILEDSGSEFDDDFSENENSESESKENVYESAEESSYSSDGDDNTAPQALKITKQEGWKWIVTGDKPSKFHFTGSPGIKPAII
jgi:hypothetical protein